jgi:hypothetical protein
MKLFTQETLNSVWQVPPSETEQDHGVDMVDVPGDEAFSAVRERVSDVEHAITIHGQPETYSDNDGSMPNLRYTRLRTHPEALWGLWTPVQSLRYKG